MKKILALFVVLMAASYAAAQGACYPDGFAATTTSTLNNSPVRVISFANIRVCTEPASGTPCTPLTNIFSNPDLAGGHALPNPFQADASGNFHFCVASPSTVHIQISGPQVTTQDIPYVTLGIGGGGGGATPCGILYDVQINDPLGTFGCDSTFFTENPNTHIVADWIFNAAQEVEISDPTHSGVADFGSTNGTAVHNHFKFGVTDALSADYGLCPPDTAPPGAGYHWTISSGTPVSPTWAGGGSCYPGQWVSDVGGATIYLAGLDSGTSGTNYILTSGNLNSNSNGCPASLTTGVTANLVPTHSNSSTTPTFQLCGLSSPAVIVKNGPSGEIPLAVNDIFSGGTASTIRLTYNVVTSHWGIQNPATTSVGNCPGLADPNTYCAGGLSPTDPRSAVIQDKICAVNSGTVTCSDNTITTCTATSTTLTCTVPYGGSVTPGNTLYVEATAACGLGCTGNTMTISDMLNGSGWTQMVNADGSGAAIPAFSYTVHSTTGGADAVTVVFGPSQTFSGGYNGAIHITELRGAVVPDGFAVNSAALFSPTFQSVTTTNATDTILATLISYVTPANCTYTPGTGYAINDLYAATGKSMGTGSTNVASASTYTPTFTSTCQSGNAGAAFTTAFTQSLYGGPGIPSFRWPKYADLVAGFDFPSQVGHTGQALVSSGEDYQPLVWTAVGSGTVTSVSGTTNQIDVATGTSTPIISLDGQFTSVNYATCTNTADALTVTLSPAPTSLVNGLTAQCKSSAANSSTTPTLNVNGLGAHTIVKSGTSGQAALVANDILTNMVSRFTYDSGTSTWELQNPQQGAAAGGTVTSVAMTGDGTVFNSAVPGSPITSSGTLAPSLHTQSANTVLAGPTTGSAAAPTFRSLVAADFPNTAVTPGSYTSTNLTVDPQGRITAASNGSGSGVSSVGLALPNNIFAVTGSPVTSSGTLTGTFNAQTSGSVLKAPAGTTQQGNKVQYKICQFTSAGASTTCTFDGAVTSGDELIAWTCGNNDIPQANGKVTDNNSDTYTYRSGLTGQDCSFFTSPNAVGGSTTITSNAQNTTLGSGSLTIIEYSGIATSSEFDANSSAFANNGCIGANQINFPAVTTSNAHDLIIGFTNNNHSGSLTVSPLDGYRLDIPYTTVASTGSPALISANQAVTGSFTPLATQTACSGDVVNSAALALKLNASPPANNIVAAPLTISDLNAGGLFIPIISYSTVASGMNSAITDTNMIASVPVSQKYQFVSTINCTASTSIATATLNLKWTDTSNTAQTQSVTATCTTLGSSSIGQFNYAIRAKSGTAITWGVTVANSPTYDADVSLVCFNGSTC